MEEFLENLLFSATYAPMHDASVHPPREVRIAHNHARRLLSDRYGFEEWQRIIEGRQKEEFWKAHPLLVKILLSSLSIPLYYWLQKQPA